MRRIFSYKAPALFATLILLFTIQISCNQKKDVTNEPIPVNEIDDHVSYTLINEDSCLQINLLTNDSKELKLYDVEASELLKLINTAEYSDFNGNIKLKMVNPDYTFIIEMKDGNKQFVQIWQEKLLMLYNAEWYNISSIEKLGSMLNERLHSTNS